MGQHRNTFLRSQGYYGFGILVLRQASHERQPSKSHVGSTSSFVGKYGSDGTILLPLAQNGIFLLRFKPL